MDRFDGLTGFAPPRAGTVIAIGNFDGVHRGHRALVDAARLAARKHAAPVVVITFEPHPLAILAPERAPPRLTTLHERLALLEQAGVDLAIVLHTDRELLQLAADDFLQKIAVSCRPRAIVEGPTFNFGRGRAGSIVTLREHAARLGYETIIVDELYGRELGGNPPINSSAIRAAIREGRVSDATSLLGRPYRVAGVVGGGDGRGAGLGFPTANLEQVPHLLPEHAVYAAIAQLPDHSLHLAAVNIGPQPTFEQMTARIEAHILDHNSDLRGRPLGLHLIERLRGQQRFASVDELVRQLHEDVRQVRARVDSLEAVRRSTPIALTDAGGAP